METFGGHLSRAPLELTGVRDTLIPIALGWSDHDDDPLHLLPPVACTDAAVEDTVQVGRIRT